MKKSIYLFAVLLISIIGCSSDDSKPDKTEILVATNWKIVAVFSNGNPQLSSECFQNNEFEFEREGEYQMTSGCLTAVGENEGLWEFHNDQSKFKWDFETSIPSSVVFEIVKLDSEVFEIEANDGDDAIWFEAIK